MTVLPTGGGKSLCYQLPAVVRTGTAVVISPLISLMEDQGNALSILGVPAGVLNSSIDSASAKSRVRDLVRGELKLLYVSPERFVMDGFLALLQNVTISFIAIDEAHCISQWGHDFRPEYRQLATIRSRFPNVSIHGFTATATPDVQRDIVEQLGLHEPLVQVGDYFRSNLIYRALPRHDAVQQILDIIEPNYRTDLGIIYCLTRKETERIATKLSDLGYSAKPYHAGLDNETRNKHQKSFSAEDTKIIVATVAFGMGIDQSNVRFVVHAGMPRSISHYQQESGRAGRDGLPAHCVLLFSDQDVAFWRRIIEQEEASPALRKAQLQAISDYAYQLRCRHRSLIEHFGQKFEASVCHACDFCLGEVQSIPESRRTSRMILSAVLKTGAMFGAGYVAQVLTGSKDKRILSNRHNQLTVYNLLEHVSKSQVHDWVNQLQQQGYLESVGSPLPTMRVSKRGRWLLRPDKFDKLESDLPVILIETRKPQKRKAADERITLYDRQLFDALRLERKQIANELGVPAFLVFGDRSLRDMATRIPGNETEFMQVFGVGTAKWERFGRRMLDAIQNYLDREKHESE